eukprot:gene12460-6211_t
MKRKDSPNKNEIPSPKLVKENEFMDKWEYKDLWYSFREQTNKTSTKIKTTCKDLANTLKKLDSITVTVGCVAKPQEGKSTFLTALLLGYTETIAYRRNISPMETGYMDINQGTTCVPVLYKYDEKPHVIIEYCSSGEFERRIQHLKNDKELSEDIKKEISNININDFEYEETKELTHIKFDLDSDLSFDLTKYEKELPVVEKLRIKKFIVHFPFRILKDNIQILDTPGHFDPNEKLRGMYQEYLRLTLPEMDVLHLFYENRDSPDLNGIKMLYDYGAFDGEQLPLIVVTKNYRNSYSIKDFSNYCEMMLSKKFKNYLSNSFQNVFDCSLKNAQNKDYEDVRKFQNTPKTISQMLSESEGLVFTDENCNKYLNNEVEKTYDTMEQFKKIVDKKFELKKNFVKNKINQISFTLLSFMMDVLCQKFPKKDDNEKTAEKWKKSWNDKQDKLYEIRKQNIKNAIDMSKEKSEKKQKISEAERKKFQNSILSESFRVLTVKYLKQILTFFTNKLKNKTESTRKIAQQFIDILNERIENVKNVKNEEIYFKTDPSDIYNDMKTKYLLFQDMVIINEDKYNGAQRMIKTIKNILDESKTTFSEEITPLGLYNNFSKIEAVPESKKSVLIFPKEPSKQFESVYKKKYLKKDEFSNLISFKDPSFFSKSTVEPTSKFSDRNEIFVNFEKKTVDFYITNDLFNQIKKLEILGDQFKYDHEEILTSEKPALYPIFIPSSNRGEEYKPCLLIDKITQNLSEEEKNLEFLILVFIEKSQEKIYLEKFSEFLKSRPKNFQFITIDFESADYKLGIGRIRNIISLFANFFHVSFFHMVDDDLKFSEYLHENFDWIEHFGALRRALFYNQKIMFCETNYSQTEHALKLEEKIKEELDSLYDEVNSIKENNNLKKKIQMIILCVNENEKNSKEKIIDFIKNWTSHNTDGTFKEISPKFHKLFEDQLNSLKNNVGQVSCFNPMNDGYQGESTSKNSTLSKYIDFLTGRKPKSHKIKLTRYSCIFVNGNLTKGIYPMNDENFFKTPRNKTEYKKLMKKWNDIQKKLPKKTFKKESLTFEKPVTIDNVTYDVDAIKEIIEEGYYHEDRILVKKLAFHGIGGFVSFAFKIEEVGYPSNFKIDDEEEIESE